MSGVTYLSLGEAKAAIERCAFEVDGGRRVVHCFAGSIGADWDVEDVLAAADKATAIGWTDSFLGRCLGMVVDGRARIFDTVTP